jgi:glycine/D-amino acid oxidase-like deaminating enzyme
MPDIVFNIEMKTKSNLDRRDFLKLAGFTGTLGLAARITDRHNDFGKIDVHRDGSDTNPQFKPVKVSADRVIKIVAGLRPYRPSGFVLKTEKINDKLVVHNYGHGGGGVSLSWGTASISVENIPKSDMTDIAVVGCGVIGLSTALLLQSKGFNVTIYTKEIPPDTTSNVAGALWGPVSVFEEGKAGIESIEQFYWASRISHKIFQDFVNEKYGIRWIKNYSLGKPFNFPGGKDLYSGFKEHQIGETLFGFTNVQEVNTMMIDIPIYLKALLEDFYIGGGKTEVRYFDSFQDITLLPERIIMNCTGLGARKLLNDNELIPVKGQLSILMPQPEIDYSYVAASEGKLLYMLPRNDGIILGGTAEKGNWSLEPDEQESERILKGHASIADSLGV